MLTKSLDLCASSQNHQTPWQYYNNGLLERDDTFSIVELCHFNFQSTMTQVRFLRECFLHSFSFIPSAHGRQNL